MGNVRTGGTKTAFTAMSLLPAPRVPSGENCGVLTGGVPPPHLRLPLVIWPSSVSSYHRRRGNPVGVITVANERRAPGNAIPALGRGRLHRASKLRCDHDVCAAAVDLLSPLIRQAGAEIRPVQGVGEGPAGRSVRSEER